MPTSFDARSFPRHLAIVLCTCAALAGCATSEPLASPDTLVGWSEEPTTPPTFEAEPTPTSLPFAEPAPTTTVVEVAETAELTGEPPRTTEAGIRITTALEQVDFNDGNGTIDTVSYDAGRVGVFLKPDFASTRADATSRKVWASSGGVLIVVYLAGPGVVEMTMELPSGAMDHAAPDADGVVVMAVPGDDVDALVGKAFDSDGTVLSTCRHDPEIGFAACS